MRQDYQTAEQEHEAENGSRSIPRRYLTRADRELLHERILAVASEFQPLTLRQLYYRLVSEDTVEKTEGGYRRLMQQVKRLRRARALPWQWIVDNSRWCRGVDSYEDLGEFLSASAQLYRRSLWRDADTTVEIWCESDSIAGPITSVASAWDVLVFPLSGFSSDSFAYAAANNIASRTRPTQIYYFGDHDPSGRQIGVDIERKLREFVAEFDGDPDRLGFERLAVTREQIRTYRLKTRPAKSTDTRSKGWLGGTVEIEALPPDVLRSLVEGCILRHLDEGAVERLRRIEYEERITLARLAGEVAS